MDRYIAMLEQERLLEEAKNFLKTGITTYQAFERTGRLSDLERVIGDFQQALSLTPDGHTNKPLYHNDLGNFFKDRFRRTGTLDDLEEAINHLQQAVLLTPNDHVDKPQFLNDLAMSCQNRFRLTGARGDLEDAIKYARQAVLLAPDDHVDKPRYLDTLGNSFQGQFRCTQALSDLEDAIKHRQQAILLTPNDHPDKPHYLNNLGISVERRFERTGTLIDLEDAIKHKQHAVSLTPDNHANKPGYLNNLGNSFQSRFRRTGALSDVGNAIKHQKQAVSLTPNNHADKPLFLNNLGNSFQSRFGCTGTLSDLEDAIRHQRQAVSLAPNDHAHKPRFLNSLGNSFQSRFGHTGTLSDLEDAIRHKQHAVLLTPDNHVDKPQLLSNLGNSLQSRFVHTGALSDLEDAIKHTRHAVSLAPNGHPNKLQFLNNLGNSFISRFKRTGTLNDIEDAIKHQQQAVSLAPDGHVDKPGCLNNLGNTFETRFQCTGMLSDLEDAIKHQQQAVLLIPHDHANKPQFLSNLGISLHSRYGHTGTLSDLEDAIKYQQQAVSLTADGHTNKLIYLNNLAYFFEIQFRHTALPKHLEEAISHFRLVATSNTSRILLRCRASRHWARLEVERNPPDALAAYHQAINLLPQVAWIGDPVATRHSQLTDLAGIPREAAAFALDINSPDLALEWLEQGRSVVWNQLLHLRASVDRLCQTHPDLCTEFTRISNELRNAATRGHSPTTSDKTKNPVLLEEETQRHHRLAEKWASLVETIRSLPNLHDFLLPKKLSVLKEAAASGPVVVINVHIRRCDALILNRGTDHVLHIPLDKLRYEDVIKMSNIFKEDLFDLRYRGSPPTGGSPRLTGILSKLYLHVVNPVLKGLGLIGAGSDPSDLPRIWWCPTGPLTFLPLHAACHSIGARTEGTFTYAISSYTPTLNALLEARAAERQPFKQIVGIAMTDTPNHSLLPAVETEIAHIEKLFSDDARLRCEILRNEQATGDQVLIRMANTGWIHLACHAVQDEQEPTQSGFCLYDRRVTIMDIIAKQFGHADFAFLSACQTATGDKEASDEAVHITAAMLGAGYRNVIGTMWAIPDEAAPRIAAKVYEVLLSGGEPDSDRAARALHEAVKEVRDSGDDDSLNSWVPFVHYGA